MKFYLLIQDTGNIIIQLRKLCKKKEGGAC